MNVFDVLREKVSDISELIRPVGWSRKIEVVETKAVIEIVNQVEQEYKDSLPEPIPPERAEYAHEAAYIRGWNECLEKIVPVQ